MARSKGSLTPANSPERRENQLIALAVDLAEKQLREGTATSQVLTHYLKLGTEQNKLEIEKMRRENELITAKVDNLKMSAHLEEIYEGAMRAMASYTPPMDDDEYE